MLSLLCLYLCEKLKPVCTSMIMWQMSAPIHQPYTCSMWSWEMRKKKCGVALKWRSLCFFGLPIKQNGDPNIWDHGWRMDFSRDESRSYTTKALHAYRTHSCIFMWTETKSSILYIGTWGQAFFAFQKKSLWRISVFCPWLYFDVRFSPTCTSSFLPSFCLTH